MSHFLMTMKLTKFVYILFIFKLFILLTIISLRKILDSSTKIHTNISTQFYVTARTPPNDNGGQIVSRMGSDGERKKPR